MGRCIIKLADYYLIWSSVVDAPITLGMSQDQLIDWLETEYGHDGLLWWDRAKPWIEKHGTSEPLYPIETILSNNRAGPNETELSKDEIIQHYCR